MLINQRPNSHYFAQNYPFPNLSFRNTRNFAAIVTSKDSASTEIIGTVGSGFEVGVAFGSELQASAITTN